MEVWQNPEEEKKQEEQLPETEELSQEMQDTLALMEFAMQGKHTDVEWIRNRQELAVVKLLKKANRKAADGFRKASRLTLKDYSDQLTEGIDNLQLLLSYRTMRLCAEFYDKEAAIMDDLLQEYSKYVFSGHFLDTYVLGVERSDEDMYDFRKGK